MINDTEEGDLEARRLFLQAVDKDPQFAQAHLGIAGTYARSTGNGYAPPPTPGRERPTRSARSWFSIREMLQPAPRRRHGCSSSIGTGQLPNGSFAP
jgi:hypothetical protein